MAPSKQFRYEFKLRLVRLVTQRGFAVDDVARHLEIPSRSLMRWIEMYAADLSFPLDEVERLELTYLEIKLILEELKQRSASRERLICSVLVIT